MHNLVNNERIGSGRKGNGWLKMTKCPNTFNVSECDIIDNDARRFCRQHPYWRIKRRKSITGANTTKVPCTPMGVGIGYCDSFQTGRTCSKTILIWDIHTKQSTMTVNYEIKSNSPACLPPRTWWLRTKMSPPRSSMLKPVCRRCRCGSEQVRT